MAYGQSVDIDSPLFRVLFGDEAILAQALEMRLDTRAGTYWDDPDYGLMVDDMTNAGLTPDAIESVAAAIKAECEKDERVSSAAVKVRVEATEGGMSLRPTIRVFPVLGAPFEFVGPLVNFANGELRKDA